MLISVCVLSSLIVFTPIGTVEAAETITDEALFMTYPTYLSNSEMDEGLSKAEATYYAVLNSYSTTDEAVAAFMSAMSEGISLTVKDTLGNWGIGETLYEEYAKAAATKYIQSMLSNENAAKNATKKVNTAYKALKTSYNIASSVDKSLLLDDLRELAKTYDVNISVEGMDKVVNKLYDAGTLKTDLDAIGEAASLWKYVLEITELHAIEMTAMQLLIDELTACGQTDSDLYLGLTLLKEEIELNQAEYVLKKYSNSKIVSYISKNIDKFFYNLVDSSSITVAFVTTFCKVYADYIYADAKADELIQATMQTSFISSIDICLSKYRTKFLQGIGTTEDIETYENIYAAYLSAYKACLESCYDVAKLDDKYSLGGDCMVWADEIEYTYTYDTYIRWCKEEVAHDIENATLDQNTGSSVITDELNEETIKSRFERIYKLYPPNSDKKFIGEYDGAKHSIGFVAKVFSMLFDKQMSNKVESKYNYILTSNKNVRVVGRLEEENVTASGLKELFSNARIGDVVLTSGQYDYFQGMILTNVTDTGIEVYDCDSKYGAEKDDYDDLIQQYELTYEWMADAFSQNGEYHSKPGISIYRAIRKISGTSSDVSLNSEEYDDSINYVIENGVLTAYNGSRTTIEIPDGVTSIADNCFAWNKIIEYVYMPDSVTSIGINAFFSCTSLKYIKLSNNLTTIERSLFEECSSLNSIYIPEKVSYIGVHAFYHTNLNTIHIPGNVKVLDNGCFSACGLKALYMEEGIERIGATAFWQCPISNDIVIPDTVIQLGDGFGNEFDGSEAQSFHIGAGIKEISSWQFDRMENLENITVSDESPYFKSIDGILYDKTAETLIRVPINKNITRLSIPNGVKEVANARDNCYITEIELPDSTETVGSQAFEDCKNLSSVLLPDKFIEISGTTFRNTPVRKNNIIDGIFYLGEYCLDVDDENALPQDLYIRENTKYISRLVSYSTCLDSITFPASVVKIGQAAFNGCNVKKIYTNSNLREIQDYAFAFCENLEEIKLHEGLDYIGYNAFSGCIKLKEINIPVTVETIRSSAFSDCDSVVSVNITSNNFESSVFQNCDNIETVIIGDNVTDLSNAICMFQNCGSLKHITFGRSLKKIPSNFASGSALTELYIPSNIENVDGAFSNCINLEKVILSEGVKTLGMHAFDGCENLSEIYIPRSLCSITYGFNNCKALTDVYYGGTQEEWQKIVMSTYGNDYLLNATIHFEYKFPAIEITDFSFSESGYVNLQVANINSSQNANVYIASYDNSGKLLEIQRPTLLDGIAQTAFSTKDVDKFKAFVWGNNIKPLCEPKEYKLQQ